MRKLVVGRRPATAGAFPHVIFWTDFSAGRKTPLEVTTLFAHTETRAEALVKKLIEENVTKGFALSGTPKPAAAPVPDAEIEARPRKMPARRKTAAE